jgi:hypothetical protein
MVTKTDPAIADTGQTGVLDGFKEPTGDGWSNLEKFRRRADPMKAIQPPKAVLLSGPTIGEASRALVLQSDLKYEPQVEVRVVGTRDYHKIQQALWSLYRMSDPRDPQHVRGSFDLRVNWVIPEPRPHVYGGGP